MVDVVQQVHVPAQDFPRLLEQFRHVVQVLGGRPQVLGRKVSVGRLVEHLVAGDAVGAGQARHAGLQANGLVAHGLVLHRLGDGVVDGLAVGVTVDGDARSAGAAQQLIDRQARDLALDVPQRHVDGRQGGHGHRTAAPVRAAIEELPDVLDLMGVTADQAGDHVIPQEADHRQFAPVQGGVADPGDSVLGRDLQRHEVAAGTGDDDLGVDDLQHGPGVAKRDRKVA